MNFKEYTLSASKKELTLKLLLGFSFGLFILDTIYKISNNINYSSRSKCALYSSAPKWLFLFYEYFVELFILVLIGIFIAILIEKYFLNLNRFIPRSPISAFLYASVLPLCSCGVIPLVTTFKNKIPFRTIITFLVAAPLLNPYIITISFTVLGLKYTVLRILCALVLALGTGIITEYFYRREQDFKFGQIISCKPGKNCAFQSQNIYEKTLEILKSIIPYLIIAGILGIVVEVLVPMDYFKQFSLSGSFFSTLLIVLIGVPVYFCNGADVLFLQPLIQVGDLSLGSALAFSLTSTSICITSLVLLTKFIGKKLTAVLLSSVILITILLSIGIQILINII